MWLRSVACHHLSRGEDGGDAATGMDLSVRDSAQLLRVSEKTIYRWVKQGRLPAYRINEQYRFNRAELLEWATSERLNVSADIFVEPDSGGPVVNLTEALKAGGNKDYTIKEMPGLNHLFQTAQTGSPTEYAKIEETISPAALEFMGNWILEHTQKDEK